MASENKTASSRTGMEPHLLAERHADQRHDGSPEPAHAAVRSSRKFDAMRSDGNISMTRVIYPNDQRVTTCSTAMKKFLALSCTFSSPQTHSQVAWMVEDLHNKSSPPVAAVAARRHNMAARRRVSGGWLNAGEKAQASKDTSIRGHERGPPRISFIEFRLSFEILLATDIQLHARRAH